MCRVYGVTRAGYYAWRERPPSARAQQDRALKAQIERVHQDSRGTYGSPRVYRELKEPGRGGGREPGRPTDARCTASRRGWPRAATTGAR